jgi:hypothetical protein
MAVVGGSEQIVVCDLETGLIKTIAKPHGHNVQILALALSPDGRLLLSGSLDRTVRLWEILSGQEILSFEKHQRAVGAVTFSPDGRLAASGGGRLGYPYDVKEPPRIRVWDVATGHELKTFSGHNSDVVALAFSPGGMTLVTALKNTSILVWDVAGIKPQARSVVPKSLDLLWADLAGDPRLAHAAIEILEAAPSRTIDYLKTHLRPTPPLDNDQVKRLIADLNNAQFTVREKATTQLLTLDVQVLPAIRKALAARPDPEMRQRLERILAQLDGPWIRGGPETIRGARAMGILERIATSDARQVLEKIARGDPEARLTREAKASLERLTEASAAP